ncbi:BIR protein [Plasmodium berghei]|uniref:BIR protein n=2 Tax=Plasmodium berghei TaxID=5821 RepID=A0A509AWN5_PLABA|nr:BIR protein [Plasmodium berghei ANKA]CXJ30287.1 BIR protein [Plasmodium berghei]SCL85935.1 BIR protein [Plasmodium berghei]VUC58722.1 BIR protein [Plasmodium berghei ANKA]|eukprot:XP_034424484.1 BIR protein [Plasmodium berghei ANKA]
MNKDVCSNFIYLMTNLEYDSSNKKYQIIKDDHFKQYCSNQNCVNELEKISAGCLYLFNEFFKDSSVFNSVAKSNINIVDYIIIWLSYMLNLKENNDGTSNLTYFYTTNINNDKYTNTIDGVEGYTSYKDLIDKKKDLMDISNENMSKFYDAFKSLCEMYTEFDDTNKNCTKCSGKAKEFVEKYKNLNENSNNTEGSPYRKILSTLSNDYNNLKNKCDSFPTISEINTSTNTAKRPEQASAQASEVTLSSSSIGNKLIPVLSIFGAIAFFLGIGYKYSLFKSRKRSRKQHLREKVKNKEKLDN